MPVHKILKGGGSCKQIVGEIIDGIFHKDIRSCFHILHCPDFAIAIDAEVWDIHCEEVQELHIHDRMTGKEYRILRSVFDNCKTHIHKEMYGNQYACLLRFFDWYIPDGEGGFHVFKMEYMTHIPK